MPFLHWLEVYHNKQWISFDPLRGKSPVPRDWLAWWRGPKKMVTLEGGRDQHMVVSVSPRMEESVRMAVRRGQVTRPLLLKFSLFSLPVNTQAVYRVLLLVPVGALLLTILRNVVGIKTFGTFMPVLIGLSFRETGLLGGVLLFCLLVACGLAVRFYLERLKLLVVPRLAAVLIVVVMLMAVFSIITHALGFQIGLSVALFPMVILTMTIEKMSIVWEERGPREALVSGLGSLITAALAFLVMNIKFPWNTSCSSSRNCCSSSWPPRSSWGAIQDTASWISTVSGRLRKAEPMLHIVRKLKDKGVLAINRRNAEYTLTCNPRYLYPLVDDKLRTKQLAQEHGIAVPELYGVIEVEGQVRNISGILGGRSDFVVKPAHGSGGEGILVVSGTVGEKFRGPDGLLITQEELNHHIFNTLSGLYSLGGQPDKVLIEYRVEFDPIFESISYQGVPDIRIVVFRCIPVMAMVRLPTRMSGGKANLHQGAVGAGIDIATGSTLTAVWQDKIIEEHPDTAHPVRGLVIPNWEQLLGLAARCCEMTGLGFQGGGYRSDREKGPLLLEINARPGLNIQIANNAGLLGRLHLIDQHHAALNTVRDRVEFARGTFSSPLMPLPVHANLHALFRAQRTMKVLGFGQHSVASPRRGARRAPCCAIIWRGDASPLQTSPYVDPDQGTSCRALS